MNRRISISQLKRLQLSDDEWALIDVRKQVDFGRQHQLYATCIPLSRMEIVAGDLLPCRKCRIVLVDDGFSSQSSGTENAAEILSQMGYLDVSILEGGVEAWAKSGNELYTGINVLSKVFGEFVLDKCRTPLVDADELSAGIENRKQPVIIDVRPWQEFVEGTIPGAQNMPGVEVVYRLPAMVPDPETEIVVTCGGRTRSIIGAQSLINAGVPNRVSALENGTLGWLLAGLDLERPQAQRLPVPTADDKDQAGEYAARLAGQRAIQRIDHSRLETWYAERESQTTYIVDVRLPEEFQTGHLAYARNVPGGQLIQTTDEYLVVRNSRIVLVDDTEVRARVTASWLQQMGWPDVYVLQGGMGTVVPVQEKRQPGMRKTLQTAGISPPEESIPKEEDIWQDACEREDATDQDRQAYIDWEVALLEQVKREKRLDFKLAACP